MLTARMGRGMAVAGGLLTAACSPDAITAPPSQLTVGTSAAALTAGDSLAIRVLSEQWGAAAQGERIALQRLLARRGPTSSAVFEEHVRTLESILSRLVRDSTTAIDDERRARLRARGGASMDLVGVPSPGIVDPQASVTQFWLPYDPTVFAQTVLTIPGTYVQSRTTGSYVRMGQTYGIVSTQKLDFQPPDAPGQPIPFIPYIATPGDYIPIQVDCTKTGIEAQATTQHEAGWLVIDYGIVLGSYTSSDTDRGMCPHVAPTAHFSMSGGGRSGSDLAALEMSAPGIVGIAADGMERDAPITSFNWYINNSYIASGFSATFFAPTGSSGVHLVMIDALGKTGSADGVVLVSQPPCDQIYDAQPCTPNGGGGGGGAVTDGYQRKDFPSGTSGGGEHYCMVTDWYVSYDGGSTWYYDGTTIDYCV